MLPLCSHFFQSSVSTDCCDKMMKYGTIILYAQHPQIWVCSSNHRMPFVLAHKTQSPLWRCLPQTMERSKPVTVHCIINGNWNWVSELQEWLLNCLWHSSIKTYDVSITCSSVPFIIAKGPLRKLPMSQNRRAFCLSKETESHLANERRWVFNLSGIGGRARWGGDWGEHHSFDADKCLEKGLQGVFLSCAV